MRFKFFFLRVGRISRSSWKRDCLKLLRHPILHYTITRMFLSSFVFFCTDVLRVNEIMPS
jgi:hypothetical protein